MCRLIMVGIGGHAARTAVARPASVHTEPEAFTAAIQQLVSERARVTLLVHDSNGLFTEPFQVVGKITIPIDDFLASGAEFPEDTLVTGVA